MIPAETIAEIKNKTEIVAVISEYVPLKKKGKNYLGLCPFHQEKTPSFTVSPEKDLWHCFGCGVGGNALSFIMKIENLSFVEAIKLLGEKVGVAVREEMTGAYKQKKEKNDLLYTICLQASEFFRAQLRGDIGGSAREYLEKRGVSEALVSEFKIGYAPQEWDSILKQLTQKGYGPERLEQAGLVLLREDKSGHYDRFRGRLIFTVTDSRDRPVAFGGRIIGEANNEPKYLNSPETNIFSKGKLLYALSQAKQEMKQSQTAILTEGYMDTLTCHQFGFKNAVATLGTALTVEQAKLLARYVKTVVLAYDADQAGQMATERGIDILREADLEVKVAALKGKDPDDMLRNEGQASFAEALKQAVPYLKYLLDRNFNNYNISAPEGKNQAAQAAVKILQTVSQDILRSEYVRYVSERLQIKEDVLLALLNKDRYYSKKRIAGPLTIRSSSKQVKAWETLLKAALEDEQMRELVLAETDVAIINDEVSRDLLKEIAAKSKEAEDLGFDWIDGINAEQTQKLARRLILKEEPWTEKTVQDCLKVLKEVQSHRQKDQLRQELKEAEARGDEPRARELLAALQKNI